MLDAIQLYQGYVGADQDRELKRRAFEEQSQQRGLQNQLLEFNMMKERAALERENQMRNRLAQMGGRPDVNTLMMLDPKLGVQLYGAQSRDMLGRQRLQSQEQIARERLKQQADAIRAKNDPALAGQRELAKQQATLSMQLPDAIATADQTVKQVDELIGDEKGKIKQHPGFESAIGATWLPGARFVPGSDTADFMRRLEQVKGGAFMEAYKTLKGGGQITEIEGEKATRAITRMDTSQSEEEFKRAAREFQGIVRNAIERAKKKVGSQAVTPGQTAPSGFKVLGVER